MCVSKALEQDKYSLQKEVELKSRLLESLQSDYDCVKNQQRQQLQEQQEHLERSHSAAINELNNKVCPHIICSSCLIRTDKHKTLPSYTFLYFLSGAEATVVSGGIPAEWETA